MGFSKKDANKIANKLGATFRKKGKHQRAVIRHEGQLVASYGISNTSSSKGHNYIPKQLHITGNQTEALAECTFSKEDYFKALREQNLLK